MGYEGGHRRAMANSVIFAKRGAPFVERWLARYDGFDPSIWDHHSVILPAALAREHPDEICRLSPAAFFWPLWTDSHVAWMHAPLDEDESARVAAAIHRNGGALYEEQVIYHAQNHAAARFMKHLTVDDIRTKNTRFNMLVRRYVNM
ncbi:hypothetical protein NLG97_g9069 [Lecanicillium saksenae]|uniref:Uncharacterized protein n=1 Tax=Lecanicillium saksenae TaxID=468837 RepID=A0ACC1QHB0_9HYPO|nr:hypothetical protein NLG97_g9069 [Lecanicillium saksenae]